MTTFGVISLYYPRLKRRIRVDLKDQDKVVIKIWDPIFLKYSRVESDKNVAEHIDRHYVEVECYERVELYNKRHPEHKIRVPQLYDYGRLELKGHTCQGYFIMMSYIENQPGVVRKK